MSCSLSKYKDLFGASGTGVHSYRFMGVALVDTLVTILIAMGITLVFKVPLDLSIIGMLVISLLIHMVFGVETGALKYLGFSCK